MADHDAAATAAKTERILATRMQLRERFLERMAATPASADARPLGSGAANRHGMPRLPPDQTETAPGRWPVLDLGVQPKVDFEHWTLEVSGLVAHPVTLDRAAFLALEQVEDVSDFHCVTGWSRLDVPWKGVRFATVAALVEPSDEARFVRIYAYDNYTTNLPLEEALKDDVLLVHQADGAPLPREHGGPVRMITPQLWAWKGAKWIRGIQLLAEDHPGFWEVRGYSNTAHPWRNDRYAA
jgi:DMSO/TMAO reductase YedYZ molybdopterin-dependent catalytic subunit